MGLLRRWLCSLDVGLYMLLAGLHDEWQIADGFLALSTIPALLYTFIERGLLGMNTAVLGARYESCCGFIGRLCADEENSIWVFTLIAMEAVKTYKSNPYFMLGTTQIPTWITPFVMVLFVSFLIPNTSFLGHVCGLLFGYGCKFSSHFFVVNMLTRAGGLGYLKFLAPPDWALRWIEGKLNLLGRLPHYVSVDQKTYGRYGVLPTTNPTLAPSGDGIALGYMGSTQRLGPWRKAG